MEKYLFKGYNAELVNYLFQTLLITYLILLLIEQILPKFVSQYFNLNYLLIIVIIAGILDVFSEHQEKKPEIIKKKDYIFILILGILGTAIIKYKTDTLGLLSWVISIIAGILIILISILVLEDEDDEKSKKDHNHHKESHIKLNNKGIAFILISILAILALISLALFLAVFMFCFFLVLLFHISFFQKQK